jgi:hypothetical protein
MLLAILKRAQFKGIEVRKKYDKIRDCGRIVLLMFLQLFPLLAYVALSSRSRTAFSILNNRYMCDKPVQWL